jgi:hypothetical protein
MIIYYIKNRRSEKYDMSEFELGRKTIDEIKREIRSNKNFCRDEKSIETLDLISYLSSGITIYTLNEDGKLNGVLNFEINVDIIKIEGLCVPPPSSGLGTLLINSVKNFSRTNSINQIKLSCYDENVLRFYLKNEFRLEKEPTRIEDSDEDSDDESESPKIRYDMIYIRTGETGGKIIKNKKRNSKKIKRNSKKIKRNSKKIKRNSKKIKRNSKKYNIKFSNKVF